MFPIGILAVMMMVLLGLKSLLTGFNRCNGCICGFLVLVVFLRLVCVKILELELFRSPQRAILIRVTFCTYAIPFREGK